MGLSSNGLDPMSEFSVIVRDAANNPLPGSLVTIDFSGCCNDIRIGSSMAQVNQVQGTRALIAPRIIVGGTTDVNGVATIRITGAAMDVTMPPIPGIVVSTASMDSGCATISATGTGGNFLLTDGVNNPRVFVAAWDLNGALGGGTGITGADLSLLFYDVLSTGAPYFQQRQRADLNGSGNVNGADAGLMLYSILIAHGSITNSSSFTSCP
jgi:hypothetical protein